MRPIICEAGTPGRFLGSDVNIDGAAAFPDGRIIWASHGAAGRGAPLLQGYTYHLAEKLGAVRIRGREF